MGNAFRVGKLFGIELRIDPSWLFIFVLVGWSLTSLFTAWHPNWSLGTSILVALASALMFFVSVLLHELAHSVVALAYGIPVRDITLHLFGGVSNIEKEPPTPMSEFLIAIVGPIASIGIGFTMLVLSALLIDLRYTTDADTAALAISRLGPLETLLVWLGPVNIIVGLFNMLPGFPLDGGRVLRAILWKITGSLTKATRIAGNAGRLVGWSLIVMGGAMALGYQVPVFGHGLMSGIWLVLIGLFLRTAAVAHLRSFEVERSLAGIEVRDLMRTDGAFVDPRTSVRELVDGWFLRHDESAYPVLEHGDFMGIVSIDDLRKVEFDAWSRSRVTDVMTPAAKVTGVSSSDSLPLALQKLGASGARQLPVLDGGVLVGMLYEKDVARWLELNRSATRDEAATIRVRHA